MNDWLLPELVRHGAALLGTAVVINAALTFAGALALAVLAARLVGSARLAKVILLAPWLRLLWDLAPGAPAGAYVLSEHAASKGELGSFMLGVGVKKWVVPFVHVRLDMHNGGERYAHSAGDMVSSWLVRHVGPAPLLVVLGFLCAVSAALLVLRTRYFFAWRARLARAEARARCEERVRLPLRTVPVLRALEGDIGPFTSGVLSPRIWLPATLGAAERRAVLEHELAHARDADVLWFGVVGVLSDLFWFLPGARWLERRFHDAAERAADACALASGVSARVLATSILAQARARLPSAPPRMAGSAASLERRLRCLTERQSPRRAARWLGRGLAICLTASVFVSVFGGYA